MKKYFFIILVAVTAFTSISVFAKSNENFDSENLVHKCTTHAHMTGKKCRYTVGCSCPGFAPTQHKEVYKQSICKNCGHHKRFH